MMKTPNVKLLIHTLLALTMTSAARADIVLGGPGVPVGMMVATKVPFRPTYQLTNCYKFVMTGIEGKGDTVGNQGNGDLKQFHISATVRDDNRSSKEKTAHLYFRDIATFNASPLKQLFLSPAEVFKAVDYPINMTLEWNGEGSAHNATGIFNILGEYQKDPPKPVGNIAFWSGNYILAYPGLKPKGIATVTRE
jgi:hypothetical protein